MAAFVVQPSGHVIAAYVAMIRKSWTLVCVLAIWQITTWDNIAFNPSEPCIFGLIFCGSITIASKSDVYRSKNFVKSELSPCIGAIMRANMATSNVQQCRGVSSILPFDPCEAITREFQSFTNRFVRIYAMLLWNKHLIDHLSDGKPNPRLAACRTHVNIALCYAWLLSSSSPPISTWRELDAEIAFLLVHLGF